MRAGTGQWAHVFHAGHGGHTGQVTAVCCADAAAVLSGGRDRNLIVWDVEAGGARQVFEGASFGVAGSVTDVAGNGGPMVISAHMDGMINIFDERTAGRVQALKGHHGAVFDVGLGAGWEVVSASADHTARIWDLRQGVDVLSFPHDDGVLAVALAGAQLVTGGLDNALSFWTVPRAGRGPPPKPARRRAVHEDWVRHIHVEGEWVVSGGKDATVRVSARRPGPDGAPPDPLTFELGSDVRGLATDPEGVYASCADGSLHLLDFAGALDAPRQASASVVR